MPRRKTAKDLGRLGEDLAARYLRGRGYEIIERNYRCQAGEIDIVAKDGSWLVFVEVRTRTGRYFGTPEESITPAKKAHLLLAAQTYADEKGWDGYWRIDVVAIELSPQGSLRRIHLIQNAVEEG